MNIEDVNNYLDKEVFSISNKTRKYLAPCFRCYGDEFSKNLVQYSTFATWIGDTQRTHDVPCVYFILNVARKRIKNFVQSIMYFRTHDSYVDDYLLGDLIYGKLHMLVLKVPERHVRSYNYFIEGKYSKMYTLTEVKRYIQIPVGASLNIEESKLMATQVLTLDPELRADVAEYYGVREEFIGELDEKPKAHQEIFNCDLEVELSLYYESLEYLIDQRIKQLDNGY